MTDPEFYCRLIEEHDFVVGADRGGDTLRALGIIPDVVVGDFDSLSSGTMRWLLSHDVDFKPYPTNKERTDGELALKTALASGARDITITAAWGGRLDHTLGNLFLLRLARRHGARCRLVEAEGEIILIDGNFELAGSPGETISLIPIERCEGVTLRGFDYEADGLTLRPGDTRGISNLLINGQGEIMIEKGQVLIIRSRPGRME